MPKIPSLFALAALLLATSASVPGASAADPVEYKVLCTVGAAVLESLAVIPPVCLLGLVVVGCLVLVTLTIVSLEQDKCQHQVGLCRITIDAAVSGQWYPCPLQRSCVTGESVVVWVETDKSYTDTTVSGRVSCGPPEVRCGPRVESCAAVTPPAKVPAAPVCEGKLDSLSTDDRMLDVVCAFRIAPFGG